VFLVCLCSGYITGTEGKSRNNSLKEVDYQLFFSSGMGNTINNTCFFLFLGMPYLTDLFVWFGAKKKIV